MASVVGSGSTAAGQKTGQDGPSKAAAGDKRLTELMERLRLKADQMKSWTDTTKALRMAMSDKRHHTECVDKAQLQKHLDQLQKAVKVVNQQTFVEKLNSVARSVGLKFTMAGADCFISSDMFYVEIKIDANGKIQDLNVAHHGDHPVPCAEMMQLLKDVKFDEFTEHLTGLNGIYKIGGDKKQKTAFMALQSLETDLNMLSQLQSSICGVSNYIHKSPLGIVQPRVGGLPMKLIYFVAPYDLLNPVTKSAYSLTVEAITDNNLGHSATVELESATPNRLQTKPLMTVSKGHDGKSLPSFPPLIATNSCSLNAYFVLHLQKPIPMSLGIIRKIQTVTNIEFGDEASCTSMLSLIIDGLSQKFTKKDLLNINPKRGFYVTLPDQQHCYYISDSVEPDDMIGQMITKVPFSHPTSVPQLLVLLRQQLQFNTLIGSCVRPHSKKDDEGSVVFEISPTSLQLITINFEHPLKDAMATVEIDLSDVTNVKCTMEDLQTDEFAAGVGSDDYLCKVIQRCMSIPITMRAVVSKLKTQVKTESITAAAAALLESKELEEAVNGQKYEIVESLLTATQHLPTISASDVVVGDADDADELVSPSLPNAAEQQQQQQQQADGADGFDYEMFYRDMGPPPKDIVESIGAEKVAKNPMLASLLDQNSPDTETSALLPSLLGGDAAAAAVAASNLQQLKQRKPRKRKVPSDARSPGSASGKSPKRKYSEDDYNMSLDLDSNDAFDLPLVSQQQQHQHQIMPPPAPAAAGGMSSGQQQQQIAASFESILRQDSKNVHGVQQGELAGLLSNIYEPPSSKSQQQTDSAIVKKPTLAKDDLANPVIGDDFIQRGFPSTSSLDELLGSLPEASAISATDTEVFLKEAIKSQDFLSTYGTGVSNTGSGGATAATGGNVSELQQRLTKSEAPEMESSSQSLGFSQPSTGQSSSTTDVGASSKSLTDALMTFESIVDSFGSGERSAVVATATPGGGVAAKAFGRSEKSEQKSSERREKGSSSGGGGGERRDKPPRDKDKKDRDYSKDDRKKSSSSSSSKFAAKSSSSSSKSDDSGTSSSGRSSEYPSKQAKELSKSEKLEQILEYGSDKSSSEKSSSQMFTSTSTGNASIVISTKSGSGGGGGSSASGGGARIATSTADGKDPGSGGSSLKMSVKKDKIKKKDSSTYSSSSSSKDPDDTGKRKKDSSSKKDRSYKKRRTGSGADGLKSSPAKSSSSSSSYSVKSDHKSVTTIKITTSGGKLQVQPASSSKTSSSTSSSSPSKSSSSSSGLVSSKTSSSSSKSSSSTTEKTVSPLQMKISSSSSNKTSSISSSSSVSSLSSSQGGGSGGGSSSLTSSSSASQPQQTAGAGSKVTKKYSSSSGVGGTTVTMSKTDSKLMANKTPTIKLKPIVMPSSGGAAASSNTNTAAAVTAPPAVAAASLKPTQTSASSAVTSSSAIVPTTPPIVPSAPITPTVTTPPLGGAAASAAASKSPIKARKSSLSAVIDKLTMAKGGSSGTGAATGSSSSSAPSKSPSAAKTTPEITGSTSIVGEKKDSLMGPPPSKTTAEPPAKILKRESSLEDKVKDTAGISKSTSDPMKDRAKPVTQIAKNSAVAPGSSASSSLSRKSSDSHRGTPSLGPEKVAAKSSIGGATVASSKFEAKRSSDSSPAMASILKTSSTSKPASGADQKGASSVSSATGSSGGGSNAGAERKFDSPDRSQMLKIRQNAKSSPVRGDIPEKDLVINKTSAGSHDLVATGGATAAAATTPASPEEKSAASPDCFKPMMLIDDKEIRSPDDVDSMRNERAPIIIPTVKIIDETSTAPRLIPTSPIAAPLPSAAASTTAAAAGAPPVETGAFRVPTPVDQIAEQPYANKKDAIIDLSIASSASEKQVSPRNISSPEDDDGLVIDCPMTPRSAAGAAVTGSAVGDVSKSPALATSIIPTTPAAAEISAPNPESPAERANASEPARKPGTSGPGAAGAVVAVAVPASPKLLQPVTSPISNPSPCEIDDDLMNEALLGNN